MNIVYVYIYIHHFSFCIWNQQPTQQHNTQRSASPTMMKSKLTSMLCFVTTVLKHAAVSSRDSNDVNDQLDV